MHKQFGEDRTCISEDMIANRQKKHRHTDGQTDTLITIFRSPIGDGVINEELGIYFTFILSCVKSWRSAVLRRPRPATQHRATRTDDPRVCFSLRIDLIISLYGSSAAPTSGGHFSRRCPFLSFALFIYNAGPFRSVHFAATYNQGRN